MRCKRLILELYRQVRNLEATSGGNTTELVNRIEALELLVSDGDYPTAAIDKFNEIVDFLASIENTDTLQGLLAEIAQLIPTNVSELLNDVGYVTLGSVVANEAFPNSWPKSGTISSLISAINQDSTATLGKIYLATVSYSDLPTGLLQAEMKIEITKDSSSGKVMLFTITSEEVSPYHWEYTSAYGRSGSWRSFLNSSDIANKANINDVQLVSNTLLLLKNDLSYIDNQGHDYVEIAGIKWATMNIGASLPSDYGLYFQWGDTQGYTAAQVGSGAGQKYFGWEDYKYGNGTSLPGDTGMTKYNATDGLATFEAVDDAAVANWGGSWRMPTTAEFQALSSAVNTAWTQVNNVYGILCTDKTDSSKTLFFPVAGCCYNGSFEGVGFNGYYWSSSLSTSIRQRAYYLLFGSNDTNGGLNISRYYGFSVRPVLDGKTLTTIVSPEEKVAWNNKSNFSGSYTDLSDKPTIPTNVSDLQNDAGYITSHQDISGKANSADLATVATSGSYTDLTNTPTIPSTLAEVGALMSVVAINTNTSSICSITGAGNSGKVQTIIYVNSGSTDVIVTVPTTYTTPDGAAIELTCPVGNYCEVSYLNISGTIYARGL